MLLARLSVPVEATRYLAFRSALRSNCKPAVASESPALAPSLLLSRFFYFIMPHHSRLLFASPFRSSKASCEAREAESLANLFVNASSCSTSPPSLPRGRIPCPARSKCRLDYFYDVFLRGHRLYRVLASGVVIMVRLSVVL